MKVAAASVNPTLIKNQTKKRIVWIDIAKALGIIAVVVGHAYPTKDTFYQTAYWWHMPLFFLIGGFFLKSLPSQGRTFGKFFRIKILPLIRDYLLAGSLVILVNFFVERQTFQYTLNYFLRLLYGGTELNGYTSAFWFMNVYILTTILVTLIITYIPQKWLQFLVVMNLFLLGTSYDSAEKILGFGLPWNADVVLLATFYMWIGWNSFKYLKHFVRQPTLWIAALALGFQLVNWQRLNVINQLIYLKSHHITSGWFAMVAPLIFIFIILGASYWLQFTPLKSMFTLIGRHTMIIMFSHKALFYIFKYIHFNAWAILSLLGIIVPLIIVIFSHILRQYTHSIRISV